MSSNRDDLEFAYKLIKREKTQDALDLLRPIVAMEPENVHAWWLLAYAASEPREAREALLMVLRLDPTYVNAPKAREMLLQLNQQYPPEFDEQERFPELAADYSVASDTLQVEAAAATEEPMPPDVLVDEREEVELPAFITEPSPELELEEAQTIEAMEDPDDLFDSMLFTDNPDELFPEEDPFAGLEQDLLAVEDTDAAMGVLPFDDDLFPELISSADSTLEPEFPDEDLFVAEPAPVVRQRGCGVRLLLLTLIVVAIALAGVLVVYFIMQEDEGTTDPGALQALALDSPQIADAQTAIEAQLPGAIPGEQGRAVVAPSSLGNTFYIELCSSPSPTLPELVTTSMGLAAGQAPTLQDQVSAVGVTIDACSTADHDKLYRAVAPMEQALQYANGTITWDEFRATWLTA